MKGDYSKAKKILGWEPKYKFKEMMHEMVGYWLESVWVVLELCKTLVGAEVGLQADCVQPPAGHLTGHPGEGERNKSSHHVIPDRSGAQTPHP